MSGHRPPVRQCKFCRCSVVYADVCVACDVSQRGATPTDVLKALLADLIEAADALQQEQDAIYAYARNGRVKSLKELHMLQEQLRAALSRAKG